MVDFPLENAGAVLALLRLSRDWHSFHSGELARAARFVCPLRAARIGYARSCLPTRHLVVTGLYRYVRNPMYVAVLGLIAGQALLFGNRDLLLYAAVVWMAFQIFVLLYEEPVLRKTYAAEYEEFCRNVPRWIPRLSAWHTPQSR